MNNNKVSIILNEYREQQNLYRDFADKLSALIQEILLSNKLSVHSITCREKDHKSLEGKLSKNSTKYNNLEDITDLAGLRIITYFSDDVDLIASLIESEFDFDESNSIDKRKILDPDRFGYLSMHYVIKLKENRASLAEYKRFSNCYAEIQIRTILQHTWAEIEHDLGYKSSLEIPKNIRRNFSQLAGLLEIADSEFLRIRNDLEVYEHKLTERIASQPTIVSIDKLSLESFVTNNSKISEIAQKLTTFMNCKLKNSVETSSEFVERFHYLGIELISEIDALLDKYDTTLIEFAQIWIGVEGIEEDPESVTLDLSISLFYLCYIILGERQSYEVAFDYFERFGIAEEHEREDMSKKLVDLFKKIVE